jgi:hypothetical protein
VEADHGPKHLQVHRHLRLVLRRRPHTQLRPLRPEQTARADTIIFNIFNNRRLDNKLNVLEGVFRNWFFIGGILLIIALQIAIVFVGGRAFQIKPGVSMECSGLSVLSPALDVFLGRLASGTSLMSGLWLLRGLLVGRLRRCIVGAAPVRIR